MGALQDCRAAHARGLHLHGAGAGGRAAEGGTFAPRRPPSLGPKVVQLTLAGDFDLLPISEISDSADVRHSVVIVSTSFTRVWRGVGPCEVAESDCGGPKFGSKGGGRTVPVS